MEKKREKLSSRLGFILLAVGCAVGLGNVWRFPYVVGQNGGAAFVIIYLVFLLILGLPIMVMEFSVGRASQRSVASSFRVLEPEGTKWHLFGYFAMIGNYLLMMFYTTIGGWMLNYLFRIATGQLENRKAVEIEAAFHEMLQSPGESVFWMILATLVGFSVCALGLRNGVERMTKMMMSALFVIMLILAIRALTLPSAIEGIRFFVQPNFERMKEQGIVHIINEAMGQAFFTLSVGIGSMAIFGSYLDKNRSLTGEAIHITLLDTFVALIAGFIIFPACSSFGVDAGSGPKLVFITLPNIFNRMIAGRLWGTLFFIFMCFAALSTIIAVFENILSFAMDLWGWSRRKAVIVNMTALTLLSLPCALGSNLLHMITPFGEGSTILDLEDFIVSNNLLPLGALVYVLFCTTRYGWGYKNFLNEADQGEGLHFPKGIHIYLKYVIPILILSVFVLGYRHRFS